MIIGNIKRQWIFCVVGKHWFRSDYFTIKGQCSRICEKCLPDDLQPIPSEVLAREYARKRLVDKDGEYVIDLTVEGL